MRIVFTGMLLVLLFSRGWAIDKEQDAAALPPVSIPEVTDFALEGEIAAAEERVIMLLVSQVHCPYCVLIKKDIIHPMIRGGDHAGRLLIRELFIDRDDEIRNFDGKAISSMEFAKRHSASFTPTLLFLDPDGNELTERMIGINTPEMYFYYVDQSIRKALAAMKS